MNFSLVFLICSLSFSDITLCFNSFRTFLALDDFSGVLDLMLDSKFKSFLLSRIHLICSECFYLLAHVFRNPDYSEFFLYYVHKNNIWGVINNLKKTSGGFIWKYLD